jgi:hypothetical protein
MKPFQPESARRDALLALLFVGFLVLNCVSLTAVLHSSTPSDPKFGPAVGLVAAAALFIPLFVRARFSFGYLIGFSFYCLIVSFLWLSYFTEGYFNRTEARWSAAASLLLVLLPLLFQVTWLRPRFTLSPQTMNRLLQGLLAFAFVVLAWNAVYGFALVSTAEADRLRGTMLRPAVLSYLDGWLVGALLPFAFAWFATERRYLPAALSIILIAAFYPVLLNKTVAFAGVWLPFLFILFSLVEARRATVLALLLPMLAGLVVVLLTYVGLPNKIYALVFGGVNYRMLTFPAWALERYFHFFAHHELTHFCQIGIIRSFTGCPYEFQLGAELSKQYDMGNLNGSLFATEGIASVGPRFAPLSALVCGLILSIGNSVSAHLPKRFIATSAGMAMQVLVNVPLSASLLSNGLLLLFLLWYVTPAESGDQSAA